MTEKIFTCPTCNEKVTPPFGKFFPFCCERCKLIDLGAWAAEKFRVEAVEAPDDQEDEPV